MRLGESTVAGKERDGQTLGEGDVHGIGHSVSAPKFVGTLDEWLYRPTPNRQTQKVANSDQSLMIGDQPTHDSSANRPDHLDVKVGGRMQSLATKTLGNHRPCSGREQKLDRRRGI